MTTITTIDLQRLGLKPDDRLLDVGCGLGRHTLAAYRHCPLLAVGVDLSLADLQQAQHRFGDFDQDSPHRSALWAQAHGARLPFADASFDKVICCEVLEHLDRPEAVISELVRVLKPDGLLAVSVPSYWPERLCWLLSRDYPADVGHLRIFRGDELPRAIESSGLRCIAEHREHGLHSPWWWLQALLWSRREQSWLVRRYKDFLDWALFRSPAWLRRLELRLNPLLGKSRVFYFTRR